MENKYLLDSNICVYILRDKKAMRERLKRLDGIIVIYQK